MEKKINEFVEQTLKALDISEDNPRLAVRGFEFELPESNKECILVIGLNPAGDKKTAEFEKTTRTYLYSLETKVKKNPYVYNNYYKPIYDLINETCENDAKWHWCNKNYEDLEEELKNSELKEVANDILQEYKEHEDRKYTIFVGDMFYFHETNSNDLPFKRDISFSDYCKDMLNLHIDTLKKNNMKIKFIYINNSKVSKWLCDDIIESSIVWDDTNGTKIFFNRMLSGGADVFSINRLANEIKDYLAKNNSSN